MSTFFKPYEGSRPFLFISYAHKQSDAVVSTIRILHEKGWRLWYDEGHPCRERLACQHCLAHEKLRTGAFFPFRKGPGIAQLL